MNRSAAVSIRRSIAVFRLRKAQCSSGLARTSAGNIGNPCAQPTRVEKERFLGCRRPRPHDRPVSRDEVRESPKRSSTPRRWKTNITFRVKPYGGLQQPDTSFLDEVALWQAGDDHPGVGLTEFVQRRKHPSLRASGERGRIHDPAKAIRLVTFSTTRRPIADHISTTSVTAPSTPKQAAISGPPSPAPPSRDTASPRSTTPRRWGSTPLTMRLNLSNGVARSRMS